MIKLGSKVRDTLTGYAGVAVARTEYQYGCARVAIEAATLTEGKPVDPQWFDEQRVEVVEEEAPKVSRDSSATSGGPQKDPSISSSRL